MLDCIACMQYMQYREPQVQGTRAGMVVGVSTATYMAELSLGPIPDFSCARSP